MLTVQNSTNCITRSDASCHRVIVSFILGYLRQFNPSPYSTEGSSCPADSNSIARTPFLGFGSEDGCSSHAQPPRESASGSCQFLDRKNQNPSWKHHSLLLGERCDYPLPSVAPSGVPQNVSLLFVQFCLSSCFATHLPSAQVQLGSK